MNSYLSQPLSFEPAEQIFLEASNAITAMVGALARSPAGHAAWRGDVLLDTP